MFSRENQELQDLLAGKRNEFIKEYLATDEQDEFLLAVENFLPYTLDTLKHLDWENSSEGLDKTLQSVDNALLLYTLLSIGRDNSPGTKYYATRKLKKLAEFKSKLLSLKHHFKGDIFEKNEFLGLTAFIKKYELK